MEGGCHPSFTHLTAQQRGIKANSLTHPFRGGLPTPLPPVSGLLCSPGEVQDPALPSTATDKGQGQVSCSQSRREQLPHNAQVRGGSSSAQPSDINMSLGSILDQDVFLDFGGYRSMLLQDHRIQIWPSVAGQAVLSGITGYSCHYP